MMLLCKNRENERLIRPRGKHTLAVLQEQSQYNGRIADEFAGRGKVSFTPSGLMDSSHSRGNVKAGRRQRGGV